MKSIYNILLFLFTIAILGAIILLLIFASKYLVDQYEHLNPQWSAAILILAVVLLFCTFILGRAIHSISANKDKVIHPEKAVVYANFIQLWWGEKQADSQIINPHLLKNQLILWGSDNVLKEYLKLEKLSDNAENSKIMRQVEKVIYAMRKDLGNRNIGLLKNDLIIGR